MLGALTDLAVKSGHRQRRAGRRCSALRRPAALGLRHGAGPSRPWPDAARHRRHALLRDREDPDDAAGRDGGIVRPHAALRRAVTRRRARTTPRTAASFDADRRRRQRCRRDQLGQALLSGRARCRRPKPASRRCGFSQLYVSLGDETADGVDRRAHLVEAAGDADLARRPGDDGGRRDVADRPAPARRRAVAPAARQPTAAASRAAP